MASTTRAGFEGSIGMVCRSRRRLRAPDESGKRPVLAGLERPPRYERKMRRSPRSYCFSRSWEQGRALTADEAVALCPPRDATTVVESWWDQRACRLTRGGAAAAFVGPGQRLAILPAAIVVQHLIEGSTQPSGVVAPTDWMSVPPGSPSSVVGGSECWARHPGGSSIPEVTSPLAAPWRDSRAGQPDIESGSASSVNDPQRRPSSSVM
jgi:hypothetical protein